LKPNLYRLARSLFCGCLLHKGEKVFLKAAAVNQINADSGIAAGVKLSETWYEAFLGGP
jgi:hypothetical protein